MAKNIYFISISVLRPLQEKYIGVSHYATNPLSRVFLFEILHKNTNIHSL